MGHPTLNAQLALYAGHRGIHKPARLPAIWRPWKWAVLCFYANPSRIKGLPGFRSTTVTKPAFSNTRCDPT